LSTVSSISATADGFLDELLNTPSIAAALALDRGVTSTVDNEKKRIQKPPRKSLSSQNSVESVPSGNESDVSAETLTSSRQDVRIVGDLPRSLAGDDDSVAKEDNPLLKKGERDMPTVSSAEKLSNADVSKTSDFLTSDTPKHCGGVAYSTQIEGEHKTDLTNSPDNGVSHKAHGESHLQVNGDTGGKADDVKGVQLGLSETSKDLQNAQAPAAFEDHVTSHEAEGSAPIEKSVPSGEAHADNRHDGISNIVNSSTASSNSNSAASKPAGYWKFHSGSSGKTQAPQTNPVKLTKVAPPVVPKPSMKPGSAEGGVGVGSGVEVPKAEAGRVSKIVRLINRMTSFEELQQQQLQQQTQLHVGPHRKTSLQHQQGSVEHQAYSPLSSSDQQCGSAPSSHRKTSQNHQQSSLERQTAPLSSLSPDKDGQRTDGGSPASLLKDSPLSEPADSNEAQQDSTSNNKTVSNFDSEDTKAGRDVQNVNLQTEKLTGGQTLSEKKLNGSASFESSRNVQNDLQTVHTPPPDLSVTKGALENSQHVSDSHQGPETVEADGEGRDRHKYKKAGQRSRDSTPESEGEGHSRYHKRSRAPPPPKSPPPSTRSPK
jgi:hypothetical protein